MNIFTQSLNAFVFAQRKGDGAFGMLVTYVHNLPTGTDAKAALKNEEAQYKATYPKMVEMPVAYRSAKSVVLTAVSMGIDLMDEQGKPKGKTELQNAIKDGKASEKSAVEKFQVAMNTATAVFASVSSLEDICKCKQMMVMLAETIVAAEKAARS